MSVRFQSFWNTSDTTDREEWHAIYKDEIGSHISDDTLVERGIPLPLTPDFKTWKNLIQSKLKCPYCFKTTRGASDYEHHLASNHSK